MDQPWDAQQPMPGPQPAMPDSRQLLAQMLMQQAPAAHERFDNPESLKLQMLAPTFGPGMPDSTRGALADGTLPPIINAPDPMDLAGLRARLNTAPMPARPGMPGSTGVAPNAHLMGARG